MYEREFCIEYAILCTLIGSSYKVFVVIYVVIYIKIYLESSWCKFPRRKIQVGKVDSTMTSFRDVVSSIIKGSFRANLMPYC